MTASAIRTVLVTAAHGRLAAAIVAAAPPGTRCIALPRLELDITNGAAVAETLQTEQPDLVINGAAYNQVDRAEAEGMDDALQINALGPARLAEACRAAAVPLVHFSTDFVFDGAREVPYREDDPTRPLGVYGASKLAGENMVLAASPANFVVRVCRLFGPPSTLCEAPPNPTGTFPLLMLHLAAERDRVRVVNDQVGSPSYTPDLAHGIWQLLAGAPGGLYQLSNAGEVSYADYAREVFRLAGMSCEVEDVSSAAYGAPARRPPYSRLDNSRAHAHGVAPLRHWKDALAEYLDSCGWLVGSPKNQ